MSAERACAVAFFAAVALAVVAVRLQSHEAPWGLGGPRAQFPVRLVVCNPPMLDDFRLRSFAHNICEEGSHHLKARLERMTAYLHQLPRDTVVGIIDAQDGLITGRAWNLHIKLQSVLNDWTQ